MNTLMTIVRTILPATRTVSTAEPARDELLDQESVPVVAPGRNLGPRTRRPPLDEPEADLAALLPRQAGPAREWTPPGDGIAADRGEVGCGGGESAVLENRNPGARLADARSPVGRPLATECGEPDDPDSGDDTDEGMSTAEYAIGTVAAAALAAVLYMIVTGDSVTSALTSIIEQALSVDF